MIFHARDDTLQLYHNAEFAASTLPDAMLVSFERGGHLVLAVELAAIREATQRHIRRTARPRSPTPPPHTGVCAADGARGRRLAGPSRSNRDCAHSRSALGRPRIHERGPRGADAGPRTMKAVEPGRLLTALVVERQRVCGFRVAGGVGREVGDGVSRSRSVGSFTAVLPLSMLNAIGGGTPSTWRDLHRPHGPHRRSP